MRFPNLFAEIHGSLIFNIWLGMGQPLLVRIIPIEPLRSVSIGPPPTNLLSDSTTTMVTVRCWNDHDVMQYEAATPADLKVARDWNAKHRNTPTEDFIWIPLISRTQ